MNATPDKTIEAAEITGHFVNGEDLADNNVPVYR